MEFDFLYAPRIYTNARYIEYYNPYTRRYDDCIDFSYALFGPLAMMKDHNEDELGLFIVDGSLRWIRHGRRKSSTMNMICDYHFNDLSILIEMIDDLGPVDMEDLWQILFAVL